MFPKSKPDMLVEVMSFTYKTKNFKILKQNRVLSDIEQLTIHINTLMSIILNNTKMFNDICHIISCLDDYK